MEDTNQAQPPDHEYIKAMLAVLGATDPFEVQEQAAPRLREAMAGLTPEEMRRAEAPGKWSIQQVIAHMADADLVTGYRFRMMLGQDNPTIQGYDADLWAERLRYSERDPEEDLKRFEVVRKSNLRLLRALSDEEWERIGQHETRGPESVRRLFKLVAAHDLVHIRQAERIRKSLRG
jgi:hypothetical protein